MIVEQLASMNHDQLREAAKNQGLKVHHKHSESTLREMIQQNMQPMPKPEQVKKIKKAEKPLEVQTPDGVLKAIEAYVNKGLEARFPGDGTWHFRYKGAEDTGTLSQSMAVIKLKAGTVSRGAFRLRGQNQEDFGGRITNNPQSAYTNTVLS